MHTSNFIPYAKQSINQEDIEVVQKALSGEEITRGRQVSLFEEEFAKFCEVKYAVAFNSGTSALQAACFAAEVQHYDTVLTTPNSFIATVGAAVRYGAKPIFVDIDPQTGNLKLDQTAYNANLPRSRGKPVIIPVHFAGVPVDVQKLSRMLTHPNSIIIEDAAHALGTQYFRGGPLVGSCAFSAMTIFSFHPAKIMTTGEGGMVTTNDERFYNRLKLFRNNGIERDAPYLQNPAKLGYYEVQALTGNFNFTDFQAALGLNQLKRISTFKSKRWQLMRAYQERLQNIEEIQLLTPAIEEHIAYHLCVIKLEKTSLQREKLMEELKNQGIGTQIHYIPLYRHPYFSKQFGEVSSYFPHMEAYYAQCLSLPLYFDMRLEDVERVIQALTAIIATL